MHSVSIINDCNTVTVEPSSCTTLNCLPSLDPLVTKVILSPVLVNVISGIEVDSMSTPFEITFISVDVISVKLLNSIVSLSHIVYNSALPVCIVLVVPLLYATLIEMLLSILCKKNVSFNLKLSDPYGISNAASIVFTLYCAVDQAPAEIPAGV